MSTISAAEVKKLRDRTGMQMGKCKEALEKSNGDMELAIELLRKENAGIQTKLASREASEGRIGLFIDPSMGVGGIVELRCETAPVAKTDQFIQLANDLARQVALRDAASPDDLLSQASVDGSGLTARDRVAEIVSMMREKMVVQRLARLTGTLGGYVHHDGSLGVLLQVEGTPTDPQVLRDVCMHIAALNPVAALRAEISQDKIDKEMEIARAQAQEQGKGKPANIIEKIAEGKLQAWLKQNILNDQPFVKDEKKTVGEHLQQNGCRLVSFVRYKVGEVFS